MLYTLGYFIGLQPQDSAQPPGKPAQAQTTTESAPQTAPEGNEPPPKPRFQFGPELGLYIPTNGKAQDAFGTTFTNIGFGFGGVRHARTKGEFYFDVNAVTNRRRGSSVMLFPIGVAYRRSLARTETAFWHPYYGAGLSVVGSQLQSERLGLPSRFRFGAGASIFSGLTFGERGYLQARYYQMSSVRGFDLSGTSLAFGYRF